MNEKKPWYAITTSQIDMMKECIGFDPAKITGTMNRKFATERNVKIYGQEVKAFEDLCDKGLAEKKPYPKGKGENPCLYKLSVNGVLLLEDIMAIDIDMRAVYKAQPFKHHTTEFQIDLMKECIGYDPAKVTGIKNRKFVAEINHKIAGREIQALDELCDKGYAEKRPYPKGKGENPQLYFLTVNGMLLLEDVLDTEITVNLTSAPPITKKTESAGTTEDSGTTITE